MTIYATLLGGETRAGRNEDLAGLLAWGLAQYRTVWAIDGDRVYATARTAYEQPARPPRGGEAGAPASSASTGRCVERIVAPVEVALPVRAGQPLGEVQVLDRGKVIAASPLVAAAAVERPGRLERVGFYAERTLHHLWGT